MPQGNLNRLQASVQFPKYAYLNVSAANLGPEGIRLSFDDNATDLLPTMTGMVTSPKPYQAVTLTIPIVKTTTDWLADQFKVQFQKTTLLGNATVYPDAPNNGTGDFNGNAGVGSYGGAGMSPFQLYNMTLETVREMSFAGTEATMVITIRGYMPVNNMFFNDGAFTPG
jgi:hypothetical protein